jgi:uncharacterized protein with HEPN domain
VKKDPKVFIGDIIESIELIEQDAENLTADKFKKNIAMQDAIIRPLEIIGEAVKNIPTVFKSNYPIFPGSKWPG